VVTPRCRGEACLIRYADDYVAAFQYQADAEHFYRELGPRLGKFGLEVAPDKTRVIPCSSQQARGCTSFDFLGFEFRWGTNRAGKPHLKRRTARKTLRRSSQRFTAWCRETCRHRVKGQLPEPATVLLPGHAHPDEVAESPQPAAQLHVARLQRAAPPLSGRPATPCGAPAPSHVGSLGWIAEASLLEEPGAGKLHAGICAGAAG
jgi:hypothetical protein